MVEEIKNKWELKLVLSTWWYSCKYQIKHLERTFVHKIRTRKCTSSQERGTYTFAQVSKQPGSSSYHHFWGGLYFQLKFHDAINLRILEAFRTLPYIWARTLTHATNVAYIWLTLTIEFQHKKPAISRPPGKCRYEKYYPHHNQPLAALAVVHREHLVSTDFMWEEVSVGKKS